MSDPTPPDATPPDATPVDAVAPGPPAPPPPGDAGPARPPLVRYREGRILGGVALGVATHLGVDVAIVRILFVIFTVVTSGLGLVAYLAGLIFIPASDEYPPTRSAAPAAGTSSGRDPMFWLGISLVVLGALWLSGGPFGRPGLLGGLGRDLLWPLVLIGFGLALWRNSDRGARAPTASPYAPIAPASAATSPSTPAPGTPAAAPWETTVSSPTSSAWQSAGDTTVATGKAGGPPPPVPPTARGSGESSWTPAPAPPRERSLLARLTLGIALVTAGVLWLLRVAGVLPMIGPGRIAAAVLLVVGIGLLVGSVAGRGRWLILVGALLLPVVIIGELLRPIGFEQWPRLEGDGSVGEVRESPRTLGDLDAQYALAAGSLRLDLSEVAFDEPTTVEIRVGMGEVSVVLPADVTVDVRGRGGAGEIRLDDVTTSGVRLDRSISRQYGDGSELLTLDIQVGLGEIRIDASSAAEPQPGTLEDPAPEPEPEPGADALDREFDALAGRLGAIGSATDLGRAADLDALLALDRSLDVSVR